MKKRILSIVLSIVMLVSLLPTAVLASSTGHDEHVCDGSCGHIDGDPHKTVPSSDWKVWDGTDTDTGTYGIQLAPGSYYLTEDLPVTSIIYITGTVNICLNGHTIQFTGTVFGIKSGATLNLCDCGTGGTVSQTDESSHNDIKPCGIDNYGTVNIYGGTVKAACFDGYGIYNYGGRANVYGGTVDGDYGIFNKNKGTVTVSGGTVSGDQNGIYNHSNCTATVSGGSIESPTYGINNYGTVKLSGAPVITGGTADIYLANNKAITIAAALSDTDGDISVLMETPGAFTSGWSTNMSSVTKEEIGNYFSSKNNGYTVQLSSGELKLATPPIDVTGVSLSKNSIALTVGSTDTLTATVAPDNATDQTVTWSSSDENVATVSGGVVTAKGAGTATITVTTNDGSKTATCTVTVTAPVTGVTLDKTSTTLTVGSTETLTATVAPDNATDKTVTWSSSDENVATVSGGVVTAMGVGTATITVTTTDGSKTATCEVKVVEAITGPIAITFDAPEVGTTFEFKNFSITNGKYQCEEKGISSGADIQAGQTYTVNVKLKPNSGYGFDSGIAATVNGESATVTPNDDGTITISYTYTFAAAAANSVEIYKAGGVVTTAQSITLPGINEAVNNVQFTAKVIDQYNQEMTEQTVEWSITEAAGVSVDENGTVTVTEKAAAGTHTLTATCGEKSDSITIKVEKKPVVTTVVMSKSGSPITADTIMIPTTGNTKVDYGCQLKDQYGESADGTVTWSITSATGISVDQNGAVTITADAAEGTYTLTATCVANSNVKGTVTIAVTPKAEQANFKFSEDTVTKTFGDDPFTIAATGVVDGSTVTYSSGDTSVAKVDESTGEVTIVGAGTATITATASATSTHAPAAASYTLTVNVGVSAVTSAPRAIDDLVYTNEEKTLVTAGIASGGTMHYSLDNVNWSSALPAATDAGEYTVYYKVVGDRNHSDSAGSSVTVNIAKADMTGITADNYSDIYDGAEHGITVNNLPEGAAVKYGTAEDACTEDSLTYSDFTDGAKTVYYKVSKKNYNDYTGYATITIDKATPEVTTWPTVNGTVYVNGTAALNSNGVVENSIRGTFELAQTSWTTSGDKTVTVTFKPDDSTNYNIAVKDDYRVTVVKRQVASVAAQASVTDKIYGTVQNEIGLPATVTITTADGKTFENVPVSWSGYNANTLDEQTLTGTLDLTEIAAEVEQPSTEVKATIKVDLQERTPNAYTYQPKTATYTGNPISHEIPDLDGVASITYSYVGISGTDYAASATAPTNAGTYEVTATFTMEAGYGAVAPKTAALTINKAEVAEPTVSGEYKYNGEAQTATLAGVESCMTVSGKTQTNAGSYTITVTLDDNYAWAAGSDGSIRWTIAKAAVSVAAKSQSIYVGQAAPNLTSPVKDTHYTVTGLFGEDTIDLSGVTMAYSKTPDTSAAGTFEITISGAVGGTNYDVEYTAGTLTISTRPVVDIPTVPTHSCQSICTVCGKCMDKTCTESACADKCSGDENVFTDVDEDTWYTDAVKYVYHRGMMEGVGDNLFDTNGTTTRAMIVTILWRLEGEPKVNSASMFNDVETGKWYSDAIAWANRKGIVEGYNGSFNPHDPITREQFATILWRYAKYKGYDVSVGEDSSILSYEDASSISEYAIPAMQWACAAGIMEGDGVNLTPKAAATRVQAAALYQRFCTKVEKK